jgi:hypothetical protein
MSIWICLELQLCSVPKVDYLFFRSFVTATFVVEAMAASHAISQWRRLEHLRRISSSVQAVRNLLFVIYYSIP